VNANNVNTGEQRSQLTLTWSKQKWSIQFRLMHLTHWLPLRPLNILLQVRFQLECQASDQSPVTVTIFMIQKQTVQIATYTIWNLCLHI